MSLQLSSAKNKRRTAPKRRYGREQSSFLNGDCATPKASASRKGAAMASFASGRAGPVEPPAAARRQGKHGSGPIGATTVGGKPAGSALPGGRVSKVATNSFAAAAHDDEQVRRQP